MSSSRHPQYRLSYIVTGSMIKVVLLHLQWDLSSPSGTWCSYLFLKPHSFIKRLVQAWEVCASSEGALLSSSGASADVDMWHQIGQKFW